MSARSASLFGRRSCDHSRDEFETVGSPRCRHRATGVAEKYPRGDDRCWRRLDEFGCLLESRPSPARRRHAGTSAMASGPAARRPPAPLRASPRSRNRHPATSATRSHHGQCRPVDQQHSPTTPAAAPGTSAARVARADWFRRLRSYDDTQHGRSSMSSKTGKTPALLSPCHNQISPPIAAFCGNRRASRCCGMV